MIKLLKNSAFKKHLKNWANNVFIEIFIFLFNFRIFEMFLNATRREFSFKIYPANMVVVHYNILKIFTMHFNKSKIVQTYFILYCNFINKKQKKFKLKFFEINNVVPRLSYFQGKF